MKKYLEKYIFQNKLPFYQKFILSLYGNLDKWEPTVAKFEHFFFPNLTKINDFE